MAVVSEAERRARRRRLVVIIVVASVIVVALVLFGQLRTRALHDKADSAIADLRPAWRKLDLTSLRDAYNQAVTDANVSGDYSAAIELVPGSKDASFVSADLSAPRAVAARYSIDTWLGSECLDVVVRSPVPNRVAFSTRKGC